MAGQETQIFGWCERAGRGSPEARHFERHAAQPSSLAMPSGDSHATTTRRWLALPPPRFIRPGPGARTRDRTYPTSIVAGKGI